MTPEEKIDAWLAGEMNDAQRRSFEDELARNPELRDQAARQAVIHETLKVGLGGATDEQRIIASVVAALQSSDTTEITTRVVREVLSKKRERRLRTTKSRRRSPPRPPQRRRHGFILFLAAAAAAAFVLIGSWLWLHSSQTPHPTPASGAGVEIVAVHGPNANVKTGDHPGFNQNVQTGEGTTVELRFADGTRFTLAARSRLQMTSALPKRFVLSQGQLRADVQPQPRPLVLKTPHGVATVLGTVFSLRVGTVGTRLDVIRGKVELEDLRSRRRVIVTPNHFAVAGRQLELHENGLLALYEFNEGNGRFIHNLAGTDADLDLQIGNPENVSWLNGALRISAPADILSHGQATEIVEACRRTNEISIEAWIRPLKVNPMTRKIGMDRIVTISADSRNRNISLGQGEMDHPPAALAVRLRRGSQKPNGLPALVTPALPAVRNGKMTHVVFVRDRTGNAALWLDGDCVATGKLAGSFAAWDSSFHLALAQEVSPDVAGRGFSADHPLKDPGAAKRSWRGEFRRLAFYDRALKPAEIKRRAMP